MELRKNPSSPRHATFLLLLVALLFTACSMPDRKEDRKEEKKEDRGESMQTPEREPAIKPSSDALLQYSRPVEVDSLDAGDSRATVAGALSGDALTITNNESRDLAIGIPNSSRSGTVRARRTVRLSGVKSIWIGSETNIWRVRGQTRYLAYDKQGKISLAEWEPR